jgi:hypothetical protein
MQNGQPNGRIRHLKYQRIEIQSAMLQDVILQMCNTVLSAFLAGTFGIDAQRMNAITARKKALLFLISNYENAYKEFLT